MLEGPYLGSGSHDRLRLLQSIPDRVSLLQNESNSLGRTVVAALRATGVGKY